MLFANSYLHVDLNFFSFPICNSFDEFCKQQKLKKTPTNRIENVASSVPSIFSRETVLPKIKNIL